MLKRILEISGIREQEAASALLMALYFFLAMAAVSIIKSVQNAVYLGRVGFDWRLPLLYLLLAVVSMAIVSLMGRLAERISRLVLNLSTLVVLTLFLLLFLALLDAEASVSYPLFYVFGGVFSVLVPTQGWMLSYELYSFRQAKRLFALLGTGGILGGAGGGYYAAAVAGLGVESHWLLVHVGVVLVVMQGLLVILRRSRRLPVKQVSATEFEEPVVNPFRTLLASSYLKYLAGMVLMSACAATLIDLEYKWVLEEKYSGSPTEITQFFGNLLGTIFVFSALFQLLATSRFLRRFGVAVTAMVLPLCLFLVAVPVVVWTAFAAVVLVKIIDGCLRSSLHKTSTELLFIPAFNDATVAVKGFIDLVIYRMGDALAASVFLALLSFTDQPMKIMGGVIMVACLLWLLFAQHLGREYLRGLRSSLELGVAQSPVHLDVTLGAEAETGLVQALRSERPTKVIFALRELIRRMPEQREAQLSATEGGSIVYRLYRHEPPPWLATIETLLDHPDQEIAAAALHLLAGYEPEKYRDQLEGLCLSSSRPTLLCLTYLERYSEYDTRLIEPARLLEWSAHAGPKECRVLASLMGKRPLPEFEPILHEWIHGEDRTLARDALEALGGFQEPRNAELLLDHLGEDWSRDAAGKALASYGDAIVQSLRQRGQDSRHPPEVRREVPRILTRIATSSAQEALLSLLYVADPLVSYRSLKGLNKVRNSRKLVFGQEALLPILQLWVQHHYELLNLNYLLDENRDREEKLLKKTVGERLEWSTEKIFRGLELFLPLGDAYFSYLGFTGDDPSLRESAIELLNMRVRGELRRTILPLLSQREVREIVRIGRELFNLSSEYNRVLSDALFTGDPWLKCCIIAVVLSQKRQNLRSRVEVATEDIHPVVRETAHWALKTWPA